ncbi:hypothetical protein K458DRAFT_405982 [Lentithecium fluviatile CBS 122367]|uniref:Uncharacterized protein n=1 Tax=Lentithecium fluviatile CBS 122367 TaxID=1168545 RepID=A0A6G1IW84_9PLEO|nr:hypothetical protein K458DRAFT_405982 [Lentithecium fluviatile CBS 122367]
MFPNPSKRKASSPLPDEPASKQRKISIDKATEKDVNDATEKNSNSDTEISDAPSSQDLDRTAAELKMKDSVAEDISSPEAPYVPLEQSTIIVQRRLRSVTFKSPVSARSSPQSPDPSASSSSSEHLPSGTRTRQPAARKSASSYPQTTEKKTSAKARRGFLKAPRSNLNLDKGEGFMPSAKSDWKFKYDSPTGWKTADLDKLLMPPARAPKEKPSKYMRLSYDVFGEMPPRALMRGLGVRKKEKKGVVEEGGTESGGDS